MIELHPKAKECFDTEATKLLFLIKPYDQTSPRTKLNGSRSEEFSQELPSDKVISHSVGGSYDGLGNQQSRLFDFNGKHVGFDGNDHSLFQAFVEIVYRKKEINCFLSRGYVENICFSLFEKKYKGEIDKDYSFSEYFLSESINVIKERKVAIPLSYISIDNSFTLGDILYEYYDKIYFDQMIVKLNKNRDVKIPEENFIQLRKDYQGVVFATKIIKAEEVRAIEILIDEIDLQLKLIRCFSPSTFFPEIDSYFNRMGRTIIPNNHCFVFEGDIPNINIYSDKVVDYYLPFSKLLLKEYITSGYIQIFDLINKDPKSNLEELLLNVAFLFSRCIESKIYQDKLVYSLVALETLLLKNTSEPIQNSIGLRLAFLTRKDINERKNVIALIKQSYILRSSYIHHGKKKEDFELLRQLQQLVWQTIINTLRSLNKFQTQEEFLNYIEDLILS